MFVCGGKTSGIQVTGQYNITVLILEMTADVKCTVSHEKNVYSWLKDAACMYEHVCLFTQIALIMLTNKGACNHVRACVSTYSDYVDHTNQ